MTGRNGKRSKPEVLQLFVFRDGQFFGTDCFAQGEVVIGRGEEADLQLDDENISRAHAVIRAGPDGLFLEDLGSVNGTCVNGEPVSHVLIDRWDEVSVGAFTIKVKRLGRKNITPAREETQIAVADDREDTVVEPAPSPPEPEAPLLETTRPPEPQPVALPQLEPATDWTPQASLDTEADEEEEASNFVEPFSLLSNLVRENFAQPAGPTQTHPVMEVIRYSSGRQVLGYDQVAHGGRYRMGPRRFMLLRYHERSSCRVFFTEDFSGGVISGNRTVALDELKTPENLVSRRRGTKIYTTKLMQGDYANLMHEGGGSFMRFTRPPVIPKTSRTRKIDRANLKIFGSAAAFHLVLITLLGIFAAKVSAVADQDIDRFAKVDMADIPLMDFEPEPEIPLDPQAIAEPEEPEKAPEEEPEPQPEKKKPPKVKKHVKHKGGGGKAGKGEGGGGPGLMAALGNLNKNKSKGILTEVTNLDAVRVPGGKARFKVSGVAMKMPTSKVVMSTGRGVGVRGGIDLLGGGKRRGGKGGYGPGALTGGTAGTKGVGGVVIGSHKRRIKKKGHLTKEQIARVVKQHLREIQYCYEKNLLLNNKLKGKIIMEWNIHMNGRVGVVKTGYNSMHSPFVARCISARIKRWQFPRPKGGGLVEVEYPFIFEQVGY